jgi:hypothetical protein
MYMCSTKIIKTLSYVSSQVKRGEAKLQTLHKKIKLHFVMSSTHWVLTSLELPLATCISKQTDELQNFSADQAQSFMGNAKRVLRNLSSENEELSQSS